ncbi:hypothetical protein, partial [Xenorhabdus santafensis]|uniref:hypothetical protein n=1 Tax=Xenorhabdus santafensis TaxID=2582833 RepID=UPI0029E7F780
QTTKTNGGGELIATLDSSVPLNGVKVSLAIENHAAVTADPVAFIPDKSKYHIDGGLTASPKGPLTVGDGAFYTFTAKIIDYENQAVVN